MCVLIRCKYSERSYDDLQTKAWTLGGDMVKSGLGVRMVRDASFRLRGVNRSLI